MAIPENLRNFDGPPGFSLDELFLGSSIDAVIEFPGKVASNFANGVIFDT
jgi:hypothetical protein